MKRFSTRRLTKQFDSCELPNTERSGSQTPVSRAHSKRNIAKIDYDDVLEESLEKQHRPTKYKKLSSKQDSNLENESSSSEEEKENTIEINGMPPVTSEYERLAQRNKEEHRKTMIELGLLDPKIKTRATSNQIKPKKTVSKPKPRPKLPDMDIGENQSPVSRAYPKRNIAKVKYLEEFDESVEKKHRRTKYTKLRSKTDSDSENESSSSEEESENTIEIDEPPPAISEYEKLAQKNIEENRKMMIELGLIDPNMTTFTSNQTKQKKTAPKSKHPPKVAEYTKRSLRLQGKTPERKYSPISLFTESPLATPLIERPKRIEEEILPMSEDGETTDFLDSLKESLSQDSMTSSWESTNSLIDNMRNLKMAELRKVTDSRVVSMCVHPMESKLLVIVGSTQGEIGLWNATNGEMAKFEPHMRNVNCLSIDVGNPSKLLSTSHDGTVRYGDFNKNVFELAYQTDEKTNQCHITWHTQIDASTLLVAHGTGEVGIVDLRTKSVQRWYHCHPRSVRTTDIHPSQRQYFISSSGTGECKIFDLRGTKKHHDNYIADLTNKPMTKGMTSAFFSPDGNKVVTTNNDDTICIFDSSNLAEPKRTHTILHDNHTGRWLSVFKTAFHPLSSNLMLVGSMLQPRRIQMYTGSGVLVRELKDEDLTTIVPVIAVHPSQSVIVGGNSTGKAHIFTTAEANARFFN